MIQRTAATATNKSIVSVQIRGNPMCFHGVDESHNLRPRHAHFAINTENDIVGNQSRGAALFFLHLVEDIDGFPVPAIAGIRRYQRSIGIHVYLNLIILLEAMEQGGGTRDPTRFPENVDNDGD